MASKMFNSGHRVHVTKSTATSTSPWEAGIYTIKNGAGGVGKGGYKFFDLTKESTGKTVPHVPAYAIEDYTTWCSSNPMTCAFAKGGKKKVKRTGSRITKKKARKSKKTKKRRKTKGKSKK